MPLGYHGRASSIVVSGTSIHRPQGQFLLNGSPNFGACEKLDFEVEFAAFIGEGNNMGECVNVNEAENHIFGFVLLNDWSARDIQRAETGLMGPLNGKNFATSISPWIVPIDALEPYRTTSHLKVSYRYHGISSHPNYFVVRIPNWPTCAKNRTRQSMISPSVPLYKVRHLHRTGLLEHILTLDT